MSTFLKVYTNFITDLIDRCAYNNSIYFDYMHLLWILYLFDVMCSTITFTNISLKYNFNIYMNIYL